MTELANVRREMGCLTIWTSSHPSRKDLDTTLEPSLRGAKGLCQQSGKALACRESARRAFGKALSRRENRPVIRVYVGGALAGSLVVAASLSPGSVEAGR